ncbi:hypothetical protein [Actinoplanes subtropicus]|uniref:hypothetical protein n=1 Tax=Actinoplanes subtropicus TaxID=543632 RepID=UPI0006895C38|nr:hypothetical protein [Actinoplanes subtropicus]
MNHDDFDRDPVTDDEFFGELADTIELVDRMTRERLSHGELDRRRKNIMDQVRGRAAGEPAGDPAPAPTPRLAVDAADLGRCMLEDDNRITVRLTDWRVRYPNRQTLREAGTQSPWRSPSHGHQLDDLHSVSLVDGGVVSHLGPAVAAAMADAERYRDGALRRAADIVSKAQREADELLAEARRTLDEARRTAAGSATTGEPSAHRVEIPRERHSLIPMPVPPSTSWNVCKVTKPVIPAGSGWLQPKVLVVDVGGGTADVLPCLAEEVMPLLAEPVAMRPAPYLMTLLSSVRDGPGRGTWQTVLRDQSVSPAWTTSWLTPHEVADAGVDLVGLGALPGALLFAQCKSRSRPSTLWGKFGRPRPVRHPLEQFLRATDHHMLAAALPETCRDTVAAAVLAGLISAWERGSRLADPHPGTRRSGFWPAWIAAGTDNMLGGFMPELLHLEGATARADGWLPILSPAQRLLLACDVEGFGRADASLQSRWQHAVRQILGEAASQVGLDSHCWQRQRAGDGELAILPPGTSWQGMFEQLMGAVDQHLHEYNRYATDDARLRLRVAVHEGTVAGTSSGFAGQAASTVTRLVDASPLKQALDEHPKASMAVAVSDPVFHKVTHGWAPERNPYVRISIPQSKGSPEDAWVFVPDGATRYPDWTAPGGRRPSPRQRPQGEPRQTAPA